MNTNRPISADTIVLNCSVQVTISRPDFDAAFRVHRAESRNRSRRCGGGQGDAENGTPRLAFTVGETAKILGISNITVYRLSTRGLLRCSDAVRTKIISRSEIERFLESACDR